MDQSEQWQHDLLAGLFCLFPPTLLLFCAQGCPPAREPYRLLNGTEISGWDGSDVVFRKEDVDSLKPSELPDDPDWTAGDESASSSADLPLPFESSDVLCLIQAPQEILCNGIDDDCDGQTDDGDLGDGVTCTLDQCGNLGDGTYVAYKALPTVVKGLSDKAISLSIGWTHTCAALAKGGMQCWGCNSEGQLGNGSTQAASGLTTVQF